MSRCLVTGAAGFVGSWICDSLLANGHEVYGMDNLSGGFRENVPEGVELWERDFSNDEDVKLVFMRRKPEIIIHAGAYAAEILSPHIRKYNYENNLIGSINLINAAVNNNCKGFVFLSSIAVYGHQAPPFTEDTPLRPRDPYGLAKMTVELDLRQACRMFDMPLMIWRPHNVYGERQNIGDNYRNVVGIFMNQCLKGDPMTIFGDGQQTRAFSYISNVAPIIANAIDRSEMWGQTFNIGGDEPCAVEKLARHVAMAMNVEYRVNHLPERQEAAHAHCDHNWLEFIYGPQKIVPLEIGIPAMAAWVKKHGSRSTPKFANIEIEKNLPESWK